LLNTLRCHSSSGFDLFAEFTESALWQAFRWACDPDGTDYALELAHDRSGDAVDTFVALGVVDRISLGKDLVTFLFKT
jgi:hypothetical protein